MEVVKAIRDQLKIGVTAGIPLFPLSSRFTTILYLWIFGLK
ncbi:hypothetical protein PU629_19620 [Pullulanibacillus sp. KACC 23026]|nr:hypothetical protein [Pullulanibacillus sp. KACC 23026]WEG12278.1 hypothetical protein PU629_19620 [Pullulanibacillus sp. KACC 23026]